LKIYGPERSQAVFACRCKGRLETRYSVSKEKVGAIEKAVEVCGKARKLTSAGQHKDENVITLVGPSTCSCGGGCSIVVAAAAAVVVVVMVVALVVAAAVVVVVA